METVLSKIAVTDIADNALSDALNKVNTNFMGGRVTKTDLASWLIIQAAAKLNQEAINEIHQAHFNQVLYLETLVKKLKASKQESLGQEEMAALAAILKSDTTKRRTKRVPTEEIQIMEKAT